MKGKIDYSMIKERRIELDQTQSNLSEITGVSLNVIKSLEIGRSDTTVENLKKICKALDLDIDDVYNPNNRNTKVITILNNKGGVGKTSVVSSLAYILAEMNHKILCIDGDMSMNLTNSLGIIPKNDNRNLSAAIIYEEDIENHIQQTQYNNIDFVVADEGLSIIDKEIYRKSLGELIIKKILANVVKKGIYDYILIDTNPVLGALNESFLYSSNFIIIPINYERFSIEGLNIVFKFINQTRKENEDLKIAGIVVNRYDVRTKNINVRCSRLLNELYGQYLFKTKLGIGVDIAKAQMDKLPILLSNKSTRLSSDYQKFTNEFLERIKLFGG